MTDTIRVRIAVAVQGDGEYSASGWTGASDRDTATVALEDLPQKRLDEQVVWVEADVPKPAIETVEGEVVE